MTATEHGALLGDILTTVPESKVWDQEPHPFLPTEMTSCASAGTTTVADLTGPRAVAHKDAIAEFQRDHCAKCPVLIQCGAHALNYEPYGLWGLSEQQRYGLGGVLPPDWPEIDVSPLDILEGIEDSGLTLADVKDIVTAAKTMREKHEAAARKARRLAKLEKQAKKASRPAKAKQTERRAA